MRATINSPAGVNVFIAMRNENRLMPPGVEKFIFSESLAVLLRSTALAGPTLINTCPRSARLQVGRFDLSLIQTDKHEEALRQGMGRLWTGEDPQTILNDVAAEWDKITERVGVDKQRAGLRRLGLEAGGVSALSVGGPLRSGEPRCAPYGSGTLAASGGK